MGCVCNKLASGKSGISPVCIGQLWVFHDLKEEEMGALVNTAFRKQYTPGERIFDQGATADKLFLIKGGLVKMSSVTEDGSEQTLDIRKAGDFIGEQMINDTFDYPVTATCMEETLTCGYTKDSFEKLVLEYPNIGLQVIKNLSKRIDWLSSKAGALASTNLEERLYSVLINVAKEHGIKESKTYTIPFQLTHEELGFLVGVHRVSVTRAIKGLKESGRLAQRGKTLVLSA